MSQKHYEIIAQELNIQVKQVAATALLLGEGATVPFVARYRKEVTGSLDEVFITKIRDRLAQLEELDRRREAILKSIEEQGKLTDELKAQILAAETLTKLEDLYLPYKPKRRTRATIAREKGLEPLSEILFKQDVKVNIEAEAQNYVDSEKGVENIEDALAGARDIIAEQVNENQEARETMRDLFLKQAQYHAKVIPGKEEEAKKYKDYFDWSEAVENAPSHRVLALRRAEKEMLLSLNLAPEEAEAIEELEAKFLKNNSGSTEQVRLAVKDAYKRLLKSSMETEIRLWSKQRADQEAIQVFADNLRQLLLAAPLGEKSVLAIDPAFRTGCKVVCLSAQGKLLDNTVIFPDRRRTEATNTILALCEKYQMESIAIGNGTASRETEAFVKSLNLPKSIIVVIVNESGASVYSASEVAREEFPDHDLTVRGAVSIGRRLMDPLAELVKIDPKSIGVGQYQHDVDQSALKQSLDDVVMSSVNAVGVEVNTASKELLTYVSGLGPQLAQNIVTYRNENGAFSSRQELKKVKRLGDKAFEQAAGFLRIRNSDHPLDRSAVHPESYHIVEQMAKDLKCKVGDLIEDKNLRKQINLKSYVSDTVGMPTLNDILSELDKPGRDPRAQFETVEFAEGINSIEDLREGMQLNGIVTNITNFGAFVDLGVHQDGLVHISQLANQYVSNPQEIVKLRQKVKVRVLEVDVERKRINLTMKDQEAKDGKKSIRKPKNQQKPRTSQKTNKRNNNKNDDWQNRLEALKNKFK